MNMKTITEIQGARLLDEIANFYTSELSHPLPMKFLEEKNLKNFSVINRLGLGFSNGSSLSNMLSNEQKVQLKEIGLLDKRGKEILANCLILPHKDELGATVGVYGLGIGKEVQGKEFLIPSSNQGFVNLEALKVWSEEIILVDNLLDLISLQSIGVENVFPILGGFYKNHLHALAENRIKKIILTKNLSTMEIEKDQLLGFGIQFVISQFEDSDSFYSLIQAGLNRETILEHVKTWEVISPIVKKTDTRKVYKDKEKWVLENGSIRYIVSGVKERFGTSLRVSIKVEKDGKRFLDSVDLLSARSRGSFKESVSQILSIESAVIEQDLLRLLDTLEAEEEKRLNDDIPQSVPMMSEAQEKMGMDLLKSPDILEQIQNDLTALGVCGEDSNKLLVYISSTSRLLPEPISIMLISPSASGKSFLLDSVKKLMPPESVINLTSVSDQALSYIEDMSNKLLVLGESVHNEKVLYLLREILSSKVLTRMVVEKDPRTGKSKTVTKTTKAVVSLMMSCTSDEKQNHENLSRMFLLRTDDSEDQTKNIHASQNMKYTLENLKKSKVIDEIISRHHFAQRLLKPIAIVNPFADSKEMKFPFLHMRSRRDNMSLNNLVISIAFLRQYQKEVKDHEGLPYIEVDELDIHTALKLFNESILKNTYSSIPQQVVRIYEDIRNLCQKKSQALNLQTTEIGFTQKELTEKISWIGGESIQKFLRKLVELEYLSCTVNRVNGQRNIYRLFVDEPIEKA